MTRGRQGIEIPSLDDDGLLTPEVGDWAEDKYRLLKLYCHLFTTSMHGKWRLVYIDLFAGAGRSRIRGTDRIVPASPFLALGVDPRFDRYVFCEASRRRLDALVDRVGRDFAQAEARFVPGDVNENVAAVLAALPTSAPRRQVLGLCFVDPFGLRNLRFRTIEKLASRRLDFMVLVPSGYDATRNQGIYLNESNPTIDLFLGDRGWRSRWGVARARRETFDVFLTDEFGQSMKRLGYLYDGIANTQMIRSTEKKLRLYRLVLFSRHELAKRFWREVRRYATPQRHLPF